MRGAARPKCGERQTSEAKRFLRMTAYEVTGSNTR
jgi:hypothetical protein